MMISPESYYRENLRVKSIEHIQNEISELRKDFDNLQIPEVPENVSAFTNDAGYQNANQVSEAIANAIEKCFSDEEFYNNLRLNCEKRSKEIAEVGAYCDIIVKKYQELI